MELKTKSIAVIGGGAAGMMAAISAKEKAKELGADVKVFILERNNRLGAKVAISGGGRCNVTTGIFDVKKVLGNYPRGSKFLTKAMYHFGPEDMVKWVEDHGVKLVTEDDLRVFPVALPAKVALPGNRGVPDKAGTGENVVKMFENTLRKLGVVVEGRAVVLSISKNAGQFEIKVADGRIFKVDKVIVTTGGNAFRQTGSTGDGYAFARSFGHTITRLLPSLNGLISTEDFVFDLAGVNFKKTELKLISSDGQRIYKRTGPFVFTHRGVSGPAVFALSALAVYEEITTIKPAKLLINFFPDDKEEVLKQRLDSLIMANGKKHLAGLLDIWLPRSICDVMAGLVGVEKDMHVARLNKEQRKKVLDLLVRFELTIVSRVAGEEFVTAGGVSLDEIDSSTMESKKCAGLYFAGEVLDVDGFTGGFNLQAAWATGHLAGFKSVEN